jgi:tripartite-type tricarboxylate transporter receptor subunit TctC
MMGKRLRYIFLVLLWPITAMAQDYPTHPVRLVVPSLPGGGTDIVARFAAQKLTEHLRYPVYVENKPGAGSLVGTDFVAKAPPDGHTLIVGGLFNMVMNSALMANLPYDPVRDFVPVGYISAYPFVALTRPDMPATLAAFAAHARQNPGKLNFGSAGIGTLQHVWGTILVKNLGLDMVHVPYKSGPAAEQDLIGGRLELMFDNLSAVKQFIDAGQLKPLAVSSAARVKDLSNVPTIDETGLTKFQGESWFGIFAPAATPAPVVEMLRRLLSEAIQDKEFTARIERDGGRMLAIPAAEQPAFLKSELERWTAQVKKYGVTID